MANRPAEGVPAESLVTAIGLSANAGGGYAGVWLNVNRNPSKKLTPLVGAGVLQLSRMTWDSKGELSIVTFTAKAEARSTALARQAMSI
jgi:hypothetical protein